MNYKLTTVYNITNAGGTEEVHEFDDFYDLQTYIEEITEDMNDANREAFLYNCKLEEV